MTVTDHSPIAPAAVPVFLRTRSGSAVTLSAEAAREAGRLGSVEGLDPVVLRVAVRPGGCSGFTYELFFDESCEGDAATIVDGVTLVCDPDSARLLDGAELVFRGGLGGNGFELEGIRTERRCGCGSSFS